MSKETLEATEWDFLDDAKDNMRVAIKRCRDLDISLDVENFILEARMFIAPAVTAWEFFLKAYYIHNKLLLMNGKRKFHQLIRLLRDKNCPIDKKDKSELRNLINIRNDMAHNAMNKKRKELIVEKIKACIDKFDYYTDRFNYYIGKLFKPEYELGGSIVSKEIVLHRLKPQNDLSENKPHLDTGTSSSIMDVEDSSHGNHRVYSLIPKRKNRSKRSSSKNARAGRRKRAD